MKKRNHWLIVRIIVVSSMIVGSMYTEAQVTEEGQLQLEIQAGNSCCVYGTSVVFGEKDINLGITEFTGDFLSYNGTTSRGCKDLVGTETGWAMTLGMSGDMENENGNKIPASNVKVSYDETTVIGGDCLPYNNSGTDIGLDTPVALVEKDGNIGTNYTKICELGTTNVKLKVVTEVGQAPGNYQGTIVITLPNFANSTCDSELIGTFYDTETDGLAYEGDQGSVGVTSDGGQFSYKPGEQITFKVGNVTLGNPVIPEVNGSVFVTDLFGLGRTEITDANVIKVGKLLQGLDADNNPDNGITIEAATAGQITENENITTFDVETKLIALGKPIRTNKEIVEHLSSTVSAQLNESIDLDYSWIKRIGGVDSDTIRVFSFDQSGYIYVAGTLMGDVSFGTGILLSESGVYYGFVAKLDQDGNGIRAKKIDDSLYSKVNSISLDNENNIYIGGYFGGTGSFGTGIVLVGDGSDDGFVAKIDSNGNWLWAQKIGSSGYDILTSIVIDQNDNIYIGGYFGGTVYFGTGITLTSTGTIDAFIGKLNTDGSWLWVRHGGGPGVYSVTKDIDVDQNGVYLASVYQGTVSFGEDSFVSSGGRDNLISKLDSNGNWLWSKKWGGTASDYIYRIQVDSQNNIYGYGYFGTTMNVNGTALTSSGGTDVFLVKLDSNGNWLWAKKMSNGLSNEEGWAFEIDALDNIYAGGRYANTGIFGNTSLVGLGVWDVFYGEISSSGERLRTKKLGGEGNDHLYKIGSDIQQNLYLVGIFDGTGFFGGDMLTSLGSSDSYLIKKVQWDQ